MDLKSSQQFLVDCASLLYIPKLMLYRFPLDPNRMYTTKCFDIHCDSEANGSSTLLMNLEPWTDKLRAPRSILEHQTHHGIRRLLQYYRRGRSRSWILNSHRTRFNNHSKMFRIILMHVDRWRCLTLLSDDHFTIKDYRREFKDIHPVNLKHFVFCPQVTARG